LALLEHRAKAEPSAWPELSEYNCFACHHELAPPYSWRQQRGFSGPLPGFLPWNSWYYVMPHFLARSEAGPVSLDALTKLEKEMLQPRPNRETVARQAGAARKELDQLLPKWNAAMTAEQVQALMKRLKKAQDDDPTSSARFDNNYENAIQLTLGLLAL